MEIPVTLVPSIDAQAWPNEIYVGYATGWMRRYDQECSRWDRYLGMTAPMTQVPVPTAKVTKKQ